MGAGSNPASLVHRCSLIPAIRLRASVAPTRPPCGVVAVEEVPWRDGKRTLTKAHMLFLARWARRLSWKETAEAFRTSWDKVFDAVEHVVTWGLEHRTLGQIDAIGVDEIQYSKGHKYLTLVYQIDLDVTRLLWVGKESSGLKS
jgi:transposase